MNRLLSSFVAVAAALFANAAINPAVAENVAIVGGKVVTMGSSGTIENGTVLIEGGRIAAVGSGLSVPAGYRVINAGGNYVTPGLMSALSGLGVTEVGAVAGTRDNGVNGGQRSGAVETAPFDAAFELAPAFNPNATNIPIARIEGVTRAMLPASSGHNIFGGIGAVVDLSGDMDTRVISGAAMSMSYGEAGARYAGGSRAAAMGYIVRALDEADRLVRRGTRSLPDRERDSVVSLIDAQALGPVVRGEMPLLVRVSRASDILQVLKLRERFENLRFVLQGAQEAWMVADQLAAAKVPVIINGMDNLPGDFESIAATLANGGRLANAGVDVIMVAVGGAGGNERLMPQAAGIAVANGMSWDDAMASITINPARAFGIGDRFGSLESGKDADVVVWDGDPLELMSAPTAVFIRGEQVELSSRQTRLRDRYMELSGVTPQAYKK